MTHSSIQIPSPVISPRWLWPWVAICAVFCTVLSYFSGLNNSVTFDETLHAVAAHAARHDFDYRLNPEDPPLWLYWANLPHAAAALPIRNDDPSFVHVIVNHGHHWDYCSEILFQPGGTKTSGHAFVAASRIMMAPLAGVVVLLAANIAAVLSPAWGRSLAVSAVAFLVALEPTLLGHGSIVKNDVSMTCIWLGLTLCIIGLGRKISTGRIILTAICVGLGPCVKYTGVLGAELLILALVARVFIGGTWGGEIFGRRIELATCWQRALAAVGITIIAAVVTVTIIWATYGFRFAATSDPEHPLLNTPEHVVTARRFTAIKQFDTTNPTEEQMAAVQIPLAIRTALLLEQKQLLPQAWLTGFVYTYASTMYRVNYILGEPTLGGRWFYFLLAPLFKLPLAVLMIFALGPILALRFIFRLTDSAAAWTCCAGVLPLVLYLAVSMTSDMNIGIRHLLPIIPLAVTLAVVGVAMAQPTLSRRILCVAAVLLLVETASSFNRCLSFFNLPSRLYGPGKLLADSNLDWGQDLLRLRQWQLANPDTPLFLLYFGTARPEAYGLKFVRLPGTRFSDQPEELPTQPGVIVASRMHMLGFPLPKQWRDAYAPLRAQQPIGSIGDTLLIYAFPPRANAQPLPMTSPEPVPTPVR